MRQKIHIINPFWELGGSEFRTLGLYDTLRKHADVQLWSEYEIAPEFATQYPIRQISLKRLTYPKTGTFIFVGVYYRIGRWYYLSTPRRVILVNNIPVSHSFSQRMRKLTWRGLRTVEIVYPSQMLKDQFNHSGFVEISPIDIQRFHPRPPSTPIPDRPFTVGRVSRDVPEKFHPQDPQFFNQLTESGAIIKLLGATCMASQLSQNPRITLLAAGAQPAHQFLQSLDCFFYRTAPEWTEPFGRVIIEAMACGLPVVCENRGGYTEVIDHGRNGYLFETDQEAQEILRSLRHNPDLRHQIGQAARASVERLFSIENQKRVREFYLA